ncbi:MAG: ABC transporter ATP-binding protein [SAR324 cluster bacterium]|nr:ABC transporter ATP-binding protein [SAR324 cluster bacterium]
MASVALKNLYKNFGQTTVVRDVNVEIDDGEFLVFVGPSGCGKTTTLRMVVGLESLSQGEIHIGNCLVNDLPPGDRDVAMVFQNYALYSHMTVSRNLGFALKARGIADQEIAKRVQRVAKMLDLEGLLERKPKQLSGGQRQRVALGRAVVRNPQVFLMDEPLSNLDALLRLKTRKELIELTTELNSTVIYVTHDQVEAMTMGHRLAVMNKGEVVQLDPPEKVFNEPSNRFVAEFIGSPPMNFLDVKVVEENFQKILKSDAFDLVLPKYWDSISESEAILGFRPHDAQLVSEGGVAGRVTVVETLGAEKLVYLKIGKNSLSILVPASEKIRSGDHLRFDLNKNALHLFNRVDEKRIMLFKQS